MLHHQGRIQDLIGGGGGPDRDRPKTAILGPQFCRILVLGPHFWWSGGARAPAPPGYAPNHLHDSFSITINNPYNSAIQQHQSCFYNFKSWASRKVIRYTHFREVHLCNCSVHHMPATVVFKVVPISP